MKGEQLPWLTGAAAEGIGFVPDAGMARRMISFARYISEFEDLDSVVDLMLREARDMTGADGAIFIAVTADGRLELMYFQHGSPSDRRARTHYMMKALPLDKSSVAGWTALNRKITNIDSVERLPQGTEFTFSRAVDGTTGYNTLSLLAVPVIGAGGSVLAVIELFNAMDEHGAPARFTRAHEQYSELLAFQIAPFVVRSMMARRMLEAMLRIAEIRDPYETGAHVQRVGMLASVIFSVWAERAGMPREEIARQRDTLRLAAMLHDIGKVGVPDSILKKPGKLTEDEFNIMKTHCAQGARMYTDAEMPLERAAYDITLYHHQRWDGRGYTGDPNIPQLAGEEIPIFARVTTAADVLDALASKRSYKEAWRFEDVLAEMHRCSGTQFDPAVIAAVDIAAPVLEDIIKMRS